MLRLKRLSATPSMSPSAAHNIGVTTQLPVPAQAADVSNLPKEMHDHPVYEEEQPETEHSNACLNISSNVRDFTLEMQQQNNEKTSVNVQQLKAPPLNVLVIDEPRNEWRPGEHTVGTQHRTACSESLLVPNLQLSLNEQDASQVFKETAVYDTDGNEARTGRHCSYRSIDIIEAVAEEVEVEVDSDKPKISHERPLDVVVSSAKQKTPDNDQFATRVNKVTDDAFRDDATAIHSPHFSVGESIECNISNYTIELASLTNCEIVCTHEKAQVHNHQWDMLLTEREIWDPGASTQLHVQFITAAGTTELQNIDVCKSAMVRILPVQLGARRVPSFTNAITHSDAFGFGWTELKASTLLVLVATYSTSTACSLTPFETWAKLQWDPRDDIPSYMHIWPEMRTIKTVIWLQGPLSNELQNQLQRSNMFSEWDPGQQTITMTCEHTTTCWRAVKTVSDLKYQLQMGKTFSVGHPGILKQLDRMLVHSIPTHELFICVHQPPDLEPFGTPFLFQSHSWYKTTTVCLQVQKCCLQTVLAYSYSVLACLSCKFSSRIAILSPICMTPDTILRMILVIHSGIILHSTMTTRDAQWLHFSSHMSCDLPQSTSLKCSTFHMINNYPSVMSSMQMAQAALQSLSYMLAIVTSYLCNLALLPSQDNRVIQFEWDPGILSLMNMMLGKAIMPHRVQSRQTPCTLSIDIAQRVDPNQFWAQLLECHSWCHHLKDIPQVQYCFLPVVLDCSYSKPTPQFVCSSSMSSSTENIHSAMSMSTATTMCMILGLSSSMRSYALGMGWEKVKSSALFILDVSSSTCTSAANQYMVLSHSGNSTTTHIYLKLLIQLLGAATTEQRHALEPSLMVVILLNGSKFTDGQLAYMPQGTSISCSEWVRHMTIVPYCWLTPFEMAKLRGNPGIALASDMYRLLEIFRAGSVSKTSHVWDTGSGSFYLSYKRLNISKMIQINSSASMTYTGVTLYELYQWEFLLQHGVQKKYNAKSLISPQKYLQLSELDIIFTTFLPP